MEPSNISKPSPTSDPGASLDEWIDQHADFVYAAALRHCAGDVHLAADVTQTVFLILARKRNEVPRRRITGWLFRTTRYAASNARKIAARRTYHEHRAGQQRVSESMMQSTDMAHPSSAHPSDRILAHLDAAIASLGAADREAVILRYLESRPASEVALVLGVSEAALRKRLTRAVAKLRNHFARHEGRLAAINVPAVLTALDSATNITAPPGMVQAVRETLAAAVGSGSKGFPATLATTTLRTMQFTIARRWLGVAGVMLIGTAVTILLLSPTRDGGDTRGGPPESPATAPVVMDAAAPRGAPINLSTPRAALRTFLVAQEAADLETMSAASVNDPDSRRIIAAWARGSAQWSKMAQAIRERFDDEANDLLNGHAVQLEMLDALPDDQFTITDERAELSMGGDETVWLQRGLDGLWRLDVAATSRSLGLTPAKEEEIARDAIARREMLYRRLIGGEIKTVQALREEMMRPPSH